VAFVAAIKATDDELIAALLEVIRRWSHLAQVDPDVAKTVANWVSFKEPEKTDFNALVPHEIETRDGYAVWKGRAQTRRRRDGFALTDERYDGRHVLYEIDHCIYCHDRDTDSCQRPRNRRTELQGQSARRQHHRAPARREDLEMHLVKRQGDNIALALIVIDNPCAGPGHASQRLHERCIYQRRSPSTSADRDERAHRRPVHAPWVRDYSC
jgi:hypothetical protein